MIRRFCSQIFLFLLSVSIGLAPLDAAPYGEGSAYPNPLNNSDALKEASFVLNNAMIQVMGQGAELPSSYQMTFRDLSGAEISISNFSLLDIDPNNSSQIQDFIRSKTADAGSKGIMLVTADTETVLSLTEDPQLQNKNVFLMPLEKKSIKSTFSNLYKHPVSHLTTSFQHDPIGCVLTTIMVGADSFYWLHSGNLTTFDQVANVIYSLILGFTFGLNKDVWAKTIRPFQNKLASFFNSIKVVKQKTLNKLLAASLASIGLSFAINLVRIPILPVDAFVNGIIGSNPLFYAGLLAVLSTIASLPNTLMVDSISQKLNPNAKFYTRLYIDLNRIILSFAAANAMLLNMSVYGWSPWVTLTVTGGISFTLFLSSHKWIPYIEDKMERPELFKKYQRLFNNHNSCKFIF